MAGYGGAKIFGLKFGKNPSAKLGGFAGGRRRSENLWSEPAVDDHDARAFHSSQATWRVSWEGYGGVCRQKGRRE